MKTALILFSLLSLLFVTEANAIERMSQDIKLPTQKVLEYEIIENASALDDDGILAGHAGAGASSSVTVTSFLAQPDVPRNIVVTPSGTTADIKAGNVTVNGTDARGGLISETFVITDNLATAVVGTKSFRTITSIVLPLEDSPYGGTWNIGWGDKLGLSKCLDSTAMIIKSFIGSTAESITATANSTSVESNGFTPTNKADGSRDFEILYVQNFRCI